MNQLPAIARIYVLLVIAAGVAIFGLCLPLAGFQQPGTFATLLVLSAATATLKVYLPVKRWDSTMSLSSAVEFGARLAK